MSNVTKVIRAKLSDTDERRARAKAARKGVPFPEFVGDAIRAALSNGRAK